MPALDIIAAADIGSIKNDKFGWAIWQVKRETLSKGTCIVEFAKRLVRMLNDNNMIALGLECPLFVPVRNDPVQLTEARNGEGNRPWSAGAGTGALATGLTETAWILRYLRTNIKTEPRVTFKWKEFELHGGLLLWEAFVSREAKANTHSGDAELAVKAFANSLPDPERSNMIDEQSAMSLVGASLLWAGWEVDTAVLKESCLVISATEGTESEFNQANCHSQAH